MNTFARIARLVLLTLVLTLISSLAVLACNPALATVCQRFERADAVFVGTLTKTERKDEGHFTTLYATFTVHETYKGTVGPVETIKFGTGDCDPTIDKIGEKYFVYKEPLKRPSPVANYTHVLNKSDGDLEFAKHIDVKEPVFRIGGFLSGLPKADLPKTRIVVNDGRKNKNISIDRDGWFEYLTRRSGTYRVTILLPITANIGWEELNSFSDIVEGTSFKYETTFRPNGCDVRQINISPK